MSADPAHVDDLVAQAAELVDRAERVCVLTGAGISTDSGIPDFRGPQGIWTKDPEAEKASHIRYYTSDADVRRKNWARRASGELWADVEPNVGHRALVRLQDRDRLLLLVTQNVDELHQRAGTDPDRVVEIHGTTRKVQCLQCDYRVEMEVVLERVRAGEADPPCPVCQGMLKSATISFGQSLVAEDLRRAEAAALGCDLFLAVGSSLQVFPVNETVVLAARNGASVVIVNGEPTAMDDLADVVVQAGITETLPAICG